MNIIRLIFLFIVGLFVRRLLSKPAKSRRGDSGKAQSFGSAKAKSQTEKNDDNLGTITEQEIDDADFEEIP